MSGGMSATTIAMMTAAAASATIAAVGAHMSGEEQKAAATQQANAMRVNANNEQAASQAKAVQQDKQTDYVLSNARAAAAASGGSATDPTVNTNLSTIAGEGRYRALIDLYGGDSAAQSLRTQADATQFAGAQAARAGNIKAGTTILSGASSMFDKYASVDSNSAPTTGSNDNLSQYKWAPWQQPGYVNP